MTCSNPGCRANFEVGADISPSDAVCPRCGTKTHSGDPHLAETALYEVPKPPESDLPARVGRYTVVRKLGEGGMGVVYLARDTQLDRPVALKVPQPGMEQNRQVLRRFYREARITASFQHPSFCPVFEVGEDGGRPFLAMAYIDGPTLAAILARDGPLAPRVAAAIARRLALALQQAHEQGVIHRDLKPSNVMINRRRELIIMDFGLARRDDDGDAELTRPGEMLGSPLYMSPEQVRGEQEAIGPATDIYALGVMLYEMLAGWRPYAGSKALVLGLIATSRPDPPSKHRPELDPTIEAICLKAMAREPAQRYRSMAELAEALGAYLGRPATQGDSPSASALPGRLPALDEIELAPEDEPEPDRSDAPAEDEEPEIPYEIAKEPPPAPLEWPDPLSIVTTAPVRKPAAPRPPKPVVLPKPRSGRLRKFRRTVVDLTYVALCLAALGAGLALLPRFLTPGRGTVEIQRPSLATRIRIDGREIPAEALKKTIELTVGEHELLATERDTIIASQRIRILPGTNPPIRVRAGTK